MKAYSFFLQKNAIKETDMERVSISDNWKFIKLPDADASIWDRSEEASKKAEREISDIDWNKGEGVSVPHTWFKDGDPYDGTAAYMKKVSLPESDDSFYLEFNGVEQRCMIFANGKKIGEHEGSYAAFRVCIPNDITKGAEVEVTVLVDNRKSEELAPMFGDFTIFGGIYRDVYLLTADKKSFDYLYYGTCGIIVRSRLLNDQAVLDIEPHVAAEVPTDSVIKYVLTTPSGKQAATAEANAYENAQLTVEKPMLWNGKGKAALYDLSAHLYVNGQETDAALVRTGFRTVKITADDGMYLNGSKYRLNGVAKHQDFGDRYNAVDKECIDKDFEIIEEIGANAVRLSHYQHPQYAYDLCDEKGLLCWAEIPMLKMTLNERLFETTCIQLKELILQNIHHPSIFCFGVQNEIAMFRDDPFMHEKCRKLSDIVHELDPDRASAGANLFSVKPKSPLNEVTDIVGYNLYFGWYYGQMEDYREHLDKIHEAKPLEPYGMSEYGVDASTQLHSKDPHVRDYTEEYQALYHETVYPIFEEKKYLWGSFVWNMFDFNSAIRNEGGTKGYNQKGLVTADRKVRKDAFYYYRAKWSGEGVLHITSKRYEKRSDESITVKVYTTEPFAELFVGGKSIATAQNNGNCTVVFEDVPLKMGENHVSVEGGNYKDSAVFYRVEEEPSEYHLPDDGNGQMVRNWFLKDDDIVKEGFLSVKNRADEIINDEDAAAVLKKYLPDLYNFMTTRDEIPLGLELLSILERSLSDRSSDEKNDIINGINSELNTIKDRY